MSLDINLLETSFASLQSCMGQFSLSFYDKLFRRYPELKPIFAKADVAVQEKKLIASLAIIVENLRNPDELELALKSLGAYHHELGTLEEHYPLIGQTLVETFAGCLGDKWNLKTEAAWLNAYKFISEVMLEGAQNPDAFLGGELTFYEWLDLYGESSPAINQLISNTTHFKYRNSHAAHESL